jgi:hypothetical protein
VKVRDGLIHDWIGAAFILGTTVKHALALVQDYNNHKNIYQPEVIDSKLISHHGNNFQIYLRLLKKRIITVVLDTNHEVHYSSLDAKRWLCRSYTTRIAEVENAGKPNEKDSRPTQVTASCCISIPIGGSRGGTAVCMLSAEPFR